MEKQSITKGFAILSVAGIISKILAVLYIPFLLAIIGDEGIGIYSTAYVVYVFIYVIANSGFPVAIAKSVSELTTVGNFKDALRVFKIARFFLIVIGAILSIVMFITAGPLSRLFNADRSVLAIAALSPTLLITAIGSSYKGYFQGKSNMTPTAISQVIEQIVNAVFTVFFAALFIRGGLEASCAGGTIGTSLGALASVIYLVHAFNKVNKTNDLSETKNTGVKRYSYKQLTRRIINYSLPITICIGAQYAGNLIDLGNIRGRLLAAGFEDSMVNVMWSYFTKYQQLMNAPISIVAALAAAVLPAISISAIEKNSKQIEFKANQAFRLCMLVVIPSAVGLAILSGPLFLIINYGQGSFLMRYGSTVLILMSIVQIQSAILQGAGKLYKATINVILGIGAKIVFNYILIGNPAININGAIIGSIVGFGLPVILNIVTIKKELGIQISLPKKAFKPLVASIVMGIWVWIVYKIVYLAFSFIGNTYINNALAVTASVSLGIIAYFYIMILINGITKSDIDALPTRIKAMIPKVVMKKVR